MDESRKKLLIKMESIVGNECYNANIQNWGAHGAYEGEGREFRYPVTFIDENESKKKFRNVPLNIDNEMFAHGYYAFGANRLGIIKALEKILMHLEEEYDFKPN